MEERQFKHNDKVLIKSFEPKRVKWTKKIIGDVGNDDFRSIEVEETSQFYLPKSKNGIN